MATRKTWHGLEHDRPEARAAGMMLNALLVATGAFVLLLLLRPPRAYETGGGGREIGREVGSVASGHAGREQHPGPQFRKLLPNRSSMLKVHGAPAPISRRS